MREREIETEKESDAEREKEKPWLACLSVGLQLKRRQ